MNYNDPGGIPHFEEWPNQNYHADWPHSRGHMYNDSEHANVIPFVPEHDCCNHDYPEDCICISSADATRWNNLSALMPLIEVNFSAISGLSGLDPEEISAVLSAYEENADIWSSASDIPLIYENLERIVNALNQKADISAVGPYLTSVTLDPAFFKGNGTPDAALTLNQDVKKLLAAVDVATSAGKIPLATVEEHDAIKDDVNKLNTNDVEISASVSEAWEQIKLLKAGISGAGMNLVEDDEIITNPDKTKQHPEIFYYTTSED